MANVQLIDLFRNYRHLEHQDQSINELEQLILEASPKALDKGQNWYQIWSSLQFENTWESACQLAKTAGAKYPECVAAQWALESDWGRSTSGKNNYFGLKGEGTEMATKEFTDGRLMTTKSKFINFTSNWACFKYLVDKWYKDYKEYKGVNRAKSTIECTELLVKEGYATDPDYAKKLMRIIRRQSRVESDVKERILDIPYEYQLDNTTGTGYRECFSSTCAMIARYYGRVKSDDEYNNIRARYGDTTNVQVQLDTLRSLKLETKYITNGTEEFLESELNAGRPIAVGWLHKGSFQTPTGGGHWTCCIGYTKDAFVFNDPNGKADVVNGGYIDNTKSSGYLVRYSRKNWLRRWEVDGKGTGWAIVVKPLTN